MHTNSPLIAIIVLGIGFAFLLGTLANRLRISMLVGYLLAGVVVGPFTPGFVGDQALALQLAEIGVILLMFGVGLHFSIDDLLSVQAIAIPGALGQVAVATILGMGVAWLLGWPLGAGPVFGLALAVSSTIVLLRSLQDRRLMDTRRGHVAVGWLVIQDLVTVLALVLLPPLSSLLMGDGRGTPSLPELATTLGWTLGKVVAFIALMMVLGRRAIPAVLHYVAHTGSRELFRLAVLSVALVVAFVATEVFGVSFALGAFVAGMVLSESQLSQRAAEETLPLRDAFAVLFFVSVGMLFDPSVLVRQPGPLVAVLAVILIGTPLTALLITRALGETTETALLIAVGLAQIGEFSFILSGLGISIGVLPDQARDLVLGASILTIFLNPVLFALMERAKPWIERRYGVPAEAPAASGQAGVTEDTVLVPTSLRDHAVLVGYGRVGRLVAAGLPHAADTLLVIEAGEDAVQELRQRSVEVISGNAADPEVLRAANLTAARLLLVAIPDAFEAGQSVEQARAANADLRIIARAHFDAAVEHLEQHGADVVVMGEREIAQAMLHFAGSGERGANADSVVPPARDNAA